MCATVLSRPVYVDRPFEAVSNVPLPVETRLAAFEDPAVGLLRVFEALLLLRPELAALLGALVFRPAEGAAGLAAGAVLRVSTEGFAAGGFAAGGLAAGAFEAGFDTGAEGRDGAGADGFAAGGADGLGAAAAGGLDRGAAAGGADRCGDESGAGLGAGAGFDAGGVDGFGVDGGDETRGAGIDTRW
jgi:hypothetical protein